jgi:hypothetical protein
MQEPTSSANMMENSVAVAPCSDARNDFTQHARHITCQCLWPQGSDVNQAATPARTARVKDGHRSTLRHTGRSSNRIPRGYPGPPASRLGESLITVLGRLGLDGHPSPGVPYAASLCGHRGRSQSVASKAPNRAAARHGYPAIGVLDFGASLGRPHGCRFTGPKVSISGHLGRGECCSGPLRMSEGAARFSAYDRKSHCTRSRGVVASTPGVGTERRMRRHRPCAFFNGRPGSDQEWTSLAITSPRFPASEG